MEFEKMVLKCKDFREGDGISITIGSGLRARAWYRGLDESRGALLIYTDKELTREGRYPTNLVVGVLPGKW
jgi:hypothetical protein